MWLKVWVGELVEIEEEISYVVVDIIFWMLFLILIENEIVI